MANVNVTPALLLQKLGDELQRAWTAFAEGGPVHLSCTQAVMASARNGHEFQLAGVALDDFFHCLNGEHSAGDVVVGLYVPESTNVFTEVNVWAVNLTVPLDHPDADIDPGHRHLLCTTTIPSGQIALINGGHVIPTVAMQRSWLDITKTSGRSMVYVICACTASPTMRSALAQGKWTDGKWKIVNGAVLMNDSEPDASVTSQQPVHQLPCVTMPAHVQASTPFCKHGEGVLAIVTSEEYKLAGGVWPSA